VNVSGNEFRTAKTGTRASKEAINLDTPDRLTQGFSAKWSKFDATPNSGVLIEGNTFDDLTRAIGTHNFSKDRYHQSVTIRGNTFKNHRSDPIRPLYWKDTVITGNLIDGAGPARTTETFGIRAAGVVNPTFTGNTFANMWAPMAFYYYNSPNKAEYKVQGLAVNRLTQANLEALACNTAGSGLQVARIQIDRKFAPGTVAASQAGIGQIEVWFNGARQVPPITPTGLSVQRSSAGSHAVRWDDARGAGLAAPSHYTVRVYSDAAGTQLAVLSRDGSIPNPQTSSTLRPDWTGNSMMLSLPAGRYWIRVTASNLGGASAPTDPIPVPA
jgi:hypothetical protein